jgi:hypothetical protein
LQKKLRKLLKFGSSIFKKFKELIKFKF